GNLCAAYLYKLKNELRSTSPSATTRLATASSTFMYSTLMFSPLAASSSLRASQIRFSSDEVICIISAAYYEV
ncbi:MAG: hypothetical protein J6S95_00515, partial [Lachnospiraceae bacterium]|nr:hypothetical protein [Lachnospiraceae bacterium]